MRHGYLPLAVAVGSLCILMAGCLPPPPPRKGPAKKIENAKPETEVQTRGFVGRWQERYGNGQVRTLMEVRSARGTLDSGDQSGELEEVEGVLYRDGTPRARYTAKRVKASEPGREIVAHGDIVLRSVDPPGIQVTCERVTWSAAANRIVAEGRVIFTYTPPGASAPVGRGGPFARATFDTELETFTIP